MEESLSKLCEKFEMLLLEGSMKKMLYKEGKLTFKDLLTHINSIQRVQGEIQNLMILQITRFYGSCKVVKQEKIVAELGYSEEV